MLATLALASKPVRARVINLPKGFMLVGRVRVSLLMNNATRVLVLLLVLGTTAAVLFYLYRQPPWGQQPQPAPPEIAKPAPEAQVEPQIRHPIEKVQPAELAKPLPALDASDDAAQRALSSLFGKKWAQKLFSPEDFVSRLVVTIDNLPRRQVPRQFLPVKPTPARFRTTGEQEDVFINPENYRRYTPYVRLAESVKTKQLVAVYVRFYPFFQEAYKELGYPSGYFNDRLVEVIDDLLATPELRGPIKLVQPKVMYQFADPELEARSAGQKILIRMGGENATRIKAKLQDIRRELTRQAPEDSRPASGSNRAQG